MVPFHIYHRDFPQNDLDKHTGGGVYESNTVHLIHTLNKYELNMICLYLTNIKYKKLTIYWIQKGLIQLEYFFSLIYGSKSSYKFILKVHCSRSTQLR